VQAQKAVHAGASGLCDHLAVALMVEPIDHDPIEAGQRQDLARRILVELLERGRLPKTGRHRTHHGGRLHPLGLLRPFAFDDQQIALEMNRKVNVRHSFDKPQVEQALATGRTQHVHAVANVVQTRWRDPGLQPRA